MYANVVKLMREPCQDTGCSSTMMAKARRVLGVSSSMCEIRSKGEFALRPSLTVQTYKIRANEPERPVVTIDAAEMMTLVDMIALDCLSNYEALSHDFLTDQEGKAGLPNSQEHVQRLGVDHWSVTSQTRLSTTRKPLTTRYVDVGIILHGEYAVSKKGSKLRIPNILDSRSTSRANLCLRSLQRGPERSIYPLHRMIDKGKDKTPAIYIRETPSQVHLYAMLQSKENIYPFRVIA